MWRTGWFSWFLDSGKGTLPEARNRWNHHFTNSHPASVELFPQTGRLNYMYRYLVLLVVSLVTVSCTSAEQSASTTVSDQLPPVTTTTTVEVATTAAEDFSHVPVIDCGPTLNISSADLAFLTGRPTKEAIEYAEANELRPIVYLPNDGQTLEQEVDRLRIQTTQDGETVALACND